MLTFTPAEKEVVDRLNLSPPLTPAQVNVGMFQAIHRGGRFLSRLDYLKHIEDDLSNTAGQSDNSELG